MKTKLVTVARTPDRGYYIEPQFGYRISESEIIDIFGPFDKKGKIFIDIDGEPMCISQSKDGGEGDLAIWGKDHANTIMMWERFYSALKGKVNFRLYSNEFEYKEELKQIKEKYEQRDQTFEVEYSHGEMALKILPKEVEDLVCPDHINSFEGLIKILGGKVGDSIRITLEK
jgi:hypothetical protein